MKLDFFRSALLHMKTRVSLKYFVTGSRLPIKNSKSCSTISSVKFNRKQVKPKNSSVAHHLLLCNHSASYDDFSILTRENKVFIRIERKLVNSER